MYSAQRISTNFNTEERRCNLELPVGTDSQNVTSRLQSSALKQQSERAWHIYVVGSTSLAQLTRRQVAKSSCYHCGHMRLLRGYQLGKPKVGYTGFHIRIQQNVAGLNVSVNNVRDAIVVQVGYPAGTPNCYVEPHIPLKRLPAFPHMLCIDRHISSNPNIVGDKTDN
jgi:hypothetical protein